MDMARLLKNTANFFMILSLAKLLAGDLAAELRNSPYRTAGVASVLGALMGIALAHRSRRIIPTRN
jgi:hypothetical protein